MNQLNSEKLKHLNYQLHYLLNYQIVNFVKVMIYKIEIELMYSFIHLLSSPTYTEGTHKGNHQKGMYPN